MHTHIFLEEIKKGIYLVSTLLQLDTAIGNDVDSKVVILTANLEMEASIHAELEMILSHKKLWMLMHKLQDLRM